ncbi:MAG: hypothetical protein ACE5MG_05090 [Candidatus Methylomirabilales bacterium]
MSVRAQVEGVKRSLLRERLWIRRRMRRLRRRLGLPALRGRTVLLIFLAILGLAYVSATVLGDFIMEMGRYAPKFYEPKDFAREEAVPVPARPEGKEWGLK